MPLFIINYKSEKGAEVEVISANNLCEAEMKAEERFIEEAVKSLEFGAEAYSSDLAESYGIDSE